jgi:POT family proton-dependent oligopeptide transporter
VSAQADQQGAAEARPAGELFGHPRGLTFLFLTQTWAEFSYFGLQAMLVYYMTQQLQLPQAQASLIYGAYGACAFFSPFFGGIIADRWLGKTCSVLAGGTLMMLGHFTMASEALLFPALALVAVGNGLFIPPLAAQVSRLYGPGDTRRDQAFSAYYMGINLGGFLAPLLCGYLGETYGWHWGFALAGLGMLVGLVTYLAGRRHIPADEVLARDRAAPTAPLSADDRRAVLTLLGVMAVVILFRIAYEQSGNTIALWISERTDRSFAVGGWSGQIPATWFQSINPLLIITLTPFLMAYWNRRQAHGRAADLFKRMALGCAIVSAACGLMITAALAYDTQGPVSALWVVGYFVLLTLGELLVLPVGLSLFGNLSPARIAATMMGAWYIAKFVGSLSAGVIGTLWSSIPASWFFAIGAASPLLAAAILLSMSRLSAASARAPAS